MMIKDKEIVVQDYDLSHCIIRKYENKILIFLGTISGNIYAFNSEDLEKPVIQLSSGFSAEITAQEFSSFGPYLLMGDIRGNVVLFDLYTQNLVQKLSKHVL